MKLFLIVFLLTLTSLTIHAQPQILVENMESKADKNNSLEYKEYPPASCIHEDSLGIYYIVELNEGGEVLPLRTIELVDSLLEYHPDPGSNRVILLWVSFLRRNR